MTDKTGSFIGGFLLTGMILVSLQVPAQDLTDLFPAEGDTSLAPGQDTSYVEDPAEDADYLDSSTAMDTDDLMQGVGDDEDSIAISALISEVGTPRDLVMVLDNSGSMKKNDPEFLATRAVSEFISGLDSQTRIAIVIFDQEITLAVPLTPLTLETRDKVLSSLENVNYRGLFTDSPAAIERAIYELKNNGRAGAQKSIVFMTDGIVDTGKPEVDLEKSKWLKEDLAADAADESIKVFGIAFTEDADFQLIQSISQKTDGEYFRALQPSDLQKVFTRIHDIINKPPETVIIEPVDTRESAPAPEEPAAVQQPMIIEVPAPAPASMSTEERVRSTIMIVAAIILFITLLAIVFLLLKRSREASQAANEVVSEAFINDINSYSGNSQYQLGQKPTMFGRVAGKDTEHLNYIVIPESTIGRRHALIEYKDYGFWISDQGSINGTFVNDQIINGEVCLKHGDKVRLHKYEFEFVMPEMDDANATVMSNTQFAGQAAAAPDAATVLKAGAPPVEEVPDFDPAFDITGTATPETDPDPEPEFELEMDEDDIDEDETLIKGDTGVMDDSTTDAADDADEDETLVRSDVTNEAQADAGDGVEDIDSEDETLIPGGFGLQEDATDSDTAAEEPAAEDETLMRSDVDALEDDDMTIRKKLDDAMDDLFEIDDDNEDKKKG